MRIGIDIDDTLTDIKDKLTNAAVEYAKNLNKYNENIDLEINDKYNDGNIYQKLLHIVVFQKHLMVILKEYKMVIRNTKQGELYKIGNAHRPFYKSSNPFYIKETN